MSLRARYNPINYTNLAGKIDHGLLLGLTDNDHVQYVNAVSDTASIDLTLDNQSIRGDIKPAGINHSAISQLLWSQAGHTIDSAINIPDDIKINFGAVPDAYIQWNNTSDRLEIGNANCYYTTGTNTLFTETLQVGNAEVDGVLKFDGVNASLNSDFAGELYISATVKASINSPLFILNGNVTLQDDKYISFGNSGFGADASIEWDGTSNYLDIQSADTRFSGTIAIPATADANTGVIEQPAGTPLLHTKGTRNFFAGGAGNFTLTGTDNISIGNSCGTSLTSGLYNLLFGVSSGQNLQDGEHNVSIGRLAMFTNVSADKNMAIGTEALKLATGGQNIAIGYQALLGDVGASGFSGSSNVGIGTNALYQLSGASGSNVAVGWQAGFGATSAINNVFIGYATGYTNEGGDGNIHIGYQAGRRAGWVSNRLIIDNQDRANLPTIQTNAILYGEMAASPTSQRLKINALTSTTNQAITLGAGATTFVATSNVMTITGDGAANTIATITGAYSGTLLTLIFVDGNVTITDDNTHAADSIDLSAAFTSADDTVLQLVYDGTSWYEVSRSVN